jgi:cytochrome c-type biogenesis protein CcmH/NrfG
VTALSLLALPSALIGFALAWRACRAPARRDTAEDAQRAAAQAQLAALAGEALLDPRLRADEQRRLTQDLAETVEEARVLPAQPARVGFATALAVALAVTVLAGALYVFLTRGHTPPSSPAAGPVPPAVTAMVARLEQRLAREGGSAADWQRLGRSYGVLGRIRDAQRAYARAAQLDPDDVMILDGYAALGTPPPPPAPLVSMLRRFEAAAQAAPDDPRAWARLAFARARLGDPGGARDAYARAYTLDPRPELLAAYAAAEYALAPERPSPQAITLYEAVLERQPDDPMALWVLGVAALQHGDRARAQELLGSLADALPDDSPMRPVVAEMLARARQAG